MSTSYFKQLHLTFTGQIEVVPTLADLPPAVGALGGPVEGAIRYVDSTKTLYTFDGTTWTAVGSGGDASFDTLTVNTLIVNNFSYLNSDVVEIGDNIVVLNSLVTGTPTLDAGITINRGDEPNASIIWNETLNEWTAGIDGNLVPFPGAAPGFVFARQGAIPTDTWLLANGIPSNLTGIRNLFANASLKTIAIDSSSISTFDVSIYEHDHVTYTLIDTVSVVAAYGGTFSIGSPLTSGKNIAAKVTSGSGFNIAATLILSET